MPRNRASMDKIFTATEMLDCTCVAAETTITIASSCTYQGAHNSVHRAVWQRKIFRNTLNPCQLRIRETNFLYIVLKVMKHILVWVYTCDVYPSRWVVG